jgi:arylsulfatase A-like enzyme
LLADKAVSIIENHDPRQPLFMYYASHSVHSPLELPDEDFQLDGIQDPMRKTYTSMVAFVDAQISRIVKSLREHSLWENTLFVCAADNGGPIYYNGGERITFAVDMLCVA